jgi:hypothetical protein
MSGQGDSLPVEGRGAKLAAPATGRPLRQSGKMARWCPATEGPQASFLRPRLFGEFGITG